MRKMRGTPMLLSLLAVLLMSACQNGSREQTSGSGELKPNMAVIHSAEEPAGMEVPESTQPTPTQEQQESAGSVLILSPVLIGEGTTEIGDSGVMTTVRLWLESGRQVTDDEPGPFQGTYLYGTFELEAVLPDGKTLPRMPLKDAFAGTELTFRQGKPFKLLFDDYNADGKPDFTIGQWAGSNGGDYAMLTVDEKGMHILAHMYSADHRQSIRYPKVSDTAFVNQYYDMESGYKDVVYRWQNGEFVADAPVDAQEVHRAGVEEE
ncbi:hypothetical protein [Paenibacillus kobensis]|uniref:hypothetical protein n=1 Tax=Paenibacillus kobensis TaxID=59841 RepID=UPI000FDA8938|nr:hypothetical protein [Paenibacillus kobensis]